MLYYLYNSFFGSFFLRFFLSYSFLLFLDGERGIRAPQKRLVKIHKNLLTRLKSYAIIK
nr:MAG TPA: hypothetical protein [Herelleviridae sp.]